MLPPGRWVRAFTGATLMLLTACALAAHVVPDTRVAAVIASVDSLATMGARAGQFSAVILIARVGTDAAPGGTVLFHRAYGLADRDRQMPIEPATPFVTASIAQAFTAVAIARLAQRGALSLDAPL